MFPSPFHLPFSRPLLFLCLSFLSFLLLPHVSPQDFVSFSYPNDPSASFLFLGDAFESHGVIQLNKNDALNGSAGRFLCATPVRMLDPATGQVASFSTSFSFRMRVMNGSSSEEGGDGMAFIVSPDNHTVGGYGEYLGAFTSKSGDETDSHTIAVEFDTEENEEVKDPSDDHIGLDVKNATSMFYNNGSSVGVRMNDGSVITAWIKYDGLLQNLQVRISVDSMEPVEPLVEAEVRLAEVMKEFMYVGFSGSKGLKAGGEEHILMTWAFSSWGLQASSSSSSSSSSSASASSAETEDELGGKRYGRNHLGLAISLTLLLLLVVILVFILWRVAKQRNRSYFRRAKDYYSKTSSPFSAGARAFTYKELSLATNGFSDTHMLSSYNPSGTFFKGSLPHHPDSFVAIKRVFQDPHLALQPFLHHITLLTSLPHRNLVPLLGWCFHNSQLILVYEFIPNDSLDKHLFDHHYEILPWSQRYHIVTGIAEGLAHLHHGTPTFPHPHPTTTIEELTPPSLHDSHPSFSPVLHRDVKASNVMLDNNFNARLGDYGLGRLVCTSRKEEAMVLEGTFGYIAPEVVETGKMTTKSDVFSFGVTVLEVACGRRAIDGELVLVDFVWEHQRHGSILNAADMRLKGCFDVGEMECLLHLGLLCTSTDSTLRPTMTQIRSILLSESSLPQLPPCPKQPFRQFPCSSSSYPGGGDIRASLQISIDDLLSS